MALHGPVRVHFHVRDPRARAQQWRMNDATVEIECATSLSLDKTTRHLSSFTPGCSGARVVPIGQFLDDGRNAPAGLESACQNGEALHVLPRLRELWRGRVNADRPPQHLSSFTNNPCSLEWKIYSVLLRSQCYYSVYIMCLRRWTNFARGLTSGLDEQAIRTLTRIGRRPRSWQALKATGRTCSLCVE